MAASHAAAPDNLLYSAWVPPPSNMRAAQATRFAVAWAWVIPLALFANGLLFWWLSTISVVRSVDAKL
ncbi:MAG: hypothetical protein IPL78_33695 [Chloroflexi bacterium]|nr:hypothetical protein [Chloroflexota bacterium]